MTTTPHSDQEAIRHKVMAPAIGLMTTAAMDMVVMLIVVVIIVSVMIAERDRADAVGIVLGFGFLATALLRLVFSAMCIRGAWETMHLRSLGLARVAAILSVIPCCYMNPFVIGCCIWFLVVISQPDVKSAFLTSRTV
jgi:hypothetical protein